MDFKNIETQLIIILKLTLTIIKVFYASFDIHHTENS